MNHPIKINKKREIYRMIDNKVNMLSIQLALDKLSYTKET